YYEPSLPELDLDGKLMKQALLNIMINARQAMPEGGELIVKTRLADTQVELEFTDTGLGMTPDVREKIFNVYYSTKKTGTGLGLPTARRIIEEHNGFISVQSEVGKGSCFIIRLPIKVKS
ncbi:MAG: two-component sensor histidine kinase, partial [Planctomycetes bacterium]|nr:two-component sensor histidine kinase [Planctomycetota bacterium]